MNRPTVVIKPVTQAVRDALLWRRYQDEQDRTRKSDQIPQPALDKDS